MAIRIFIKVHIGICRWKITRVINWLLVTQISQRRLHISAMFCSFLTLFTRVCSSELNPRPMRNGLWAILAFIVCTDPHFENLPEIVDHPGTFGILFSTYYALGHTYFNLTYYLGWIVWTLGRRDNLGISHILNVFGRIQMSHFNLD